jgi:hypothetical protein
MVSSLHETFIARARQSPHAVGVVEPGRGSITYGELDALSDRLRDRLVAIGVGRGDRVGIYLRKSIDAVATLLATLKAGAAYVPVDPGAPVARGAYILQDCAVKAVVVEAARADRLATELAGLGPTPVLIVIDGLQDGGTGLRLALDAGEQAPVADTVRSNASDLAYILYTSGSTGQPKGVMLSHDNAVSFVDWCSEVFAPTAADRLLVACAVSLRPLDSRPPRVPEARRHTGADRRRHRQGRAAARAADRRRADLDLVFGAVHPRLAGAVRPPRAARLLAAAACAVRRRGLCGQAFAHALRALARQPRYFNLYGPTETNVCTWYEVRCRCRPNATRPTRSAGCVPTCAPAYSTNRALPVARGQTKASCASPGRQ